jgi:hypothetical protein
MSFDWKIMAKKGLISAGIVIGAGLISLWQNDAKFMALIPVVEMALNWLKHRNDE